MSTTDLRLATTRAIVALALLAGAFVLFGCTAERGDADGGSSGGDSTTEEPSRPELPDAWVIAINDSDSYTEGDITYSIDLELTATNPTQNIAGVYTGSATAKTATVGTVQGLPLNTSATAQSSSLEFTLVDEAGTADGLAPLTSEDAVYSGSGTIAMQTSGSGTVGPAGGSFSNSSGEPVEVRVEGPVVTFKVVISGHTYTFGGTLQGQ